MKIALGQINPTIGDFAGNCAKICQCMDRAANLGCDLAVFPEMALLGYPPLDFLDGNNFVLDSLGFWEQLLEASRKIAVICGVVAQNRSRTGKPFFNAALFCAQGQIQAQARKMLLPSYDVFDETRYFEPGKKPLVIEFKGLRLGLTVCEDVWNKEGYLPGGLYDQDPVQDLAGQQVDLLINIAASPFHRGKSKEVGRLLQERAREVNAPVLYVNQVGGNDQLIFQGHSMVWDRSGRQLTCAADFEEDLLVWDSEKDQQEIAPKMLGREQEILQALCLGLRDYMSKCGFQKAVLGLSGGVDSALAACVARIALGPENVLALALPGPYNAPHSLEDAQELARRLGIWLRTVDIEGLFDLTKQELQPIFQDMPEDVTEENIQSRLRGLLLMAVSNKFRALLLNTGNKSELAVGYCTLYGDMNGGISVLGDIPKTLVYQLSRHINQTRSWIPERIITRAPSAELSPEQKDLDNLPEYEVLDSILQAYIEEQQGLEEMTAQGWDRELVSWVVRRVLANEYKRRQAPPVLKVTGKAFGLGRRLPIAHGFGQRL
ncbi:MAG: NAD+ synthase [Thermodesulfobacteriota bacterium]